MKISFSRLLLVVAFFTTILFPQCDQQEEFKHKPEVITKTTVALTLNVATNKHTISNVYRVIKDTFNYKSVDTLTQRKSWGRDTFYIAEFFDTVFIEGTRTPRTDSAGKVRLSVEQRILNKEYILYDFNKNWRD